MEVILGLVGLASTPMEYQINLLLRGKSALSMIFCAITTIFWETHNDKKRYVVEERYGK